MVFVFFEEGAAAVNLWQRFTSITDQMFTFREQEFSTFTLKSPDLCPQKLHPSTAITTTRLQNFI